MTVFLSCSLPYRYSGTLDKDNVGRPQKTDVPPLGVTVRLFTAAEGRGNAASASSSSPTLIPMGTASPGSAAAREGAAQGERAEPLVGPSPFACFVAFAKANRTAWLAWLASSAAPSPPVKKKKKDPQLQSEEALELFFSSQQ